MSSFDAPHFMFLFSMKNGKKKLGYGRDPKDAIENLRLRLTAAEMDQILVDEFVKTNQREMRQHLDELG